MCDTRYDVAIALDVGGGEDGNAVLAACEDRSAVVVTAVPAPGIPDVKALLRAPGRQELGRWRQPRLGTLVVYATDIGDGPRAGGWKSRIRARMRPRRIWPPVPRS